MHIVIATDGLPFDGQTIRETALGGSESAVYYMARELAKRGHRVDVFCRCQRPGAYEGVVYNDVHELPRIGPALYPDVLIISRFMQMFRAPIRGKMQILWDHDILTEPEPLLSFSVFCDRIVNLSAYHVKQYKDKLPDENHAPVRALFRQSRNGYDPEIVPQKAEKSDHLYLFTSRPERGLLNLLKMWPKIKRIDPQAVLGICNYKTVKDPRVEEIWRECEKVIRHYPSIRMLGNMAKHELYQVLARAHAVLYPTEFPEISCISALEAQACGTPFIATDDFALSETVAPDTRVPRDGNIEHDEKVFADYEKRFLEKIRLLRDPQVYQLAQNTARKWVEEYTWEKIAAEWESEMFSFFHNRLSMTPEENVRLGLRAIGHTEGDDGSGLVSPRPLSEFEIEALTPPLARLCSEKTAVTCAGKHKPLVEAIAAELPQLRLATGDEPLGAQIVITDCLQCGKLFPSDLPTGITVCYLLRTGDWFDRCMEDRVYAFDALDIETVFGNQDNFDAQFINMGLSNRLGYIGYWLVTYNYDPGKPLGAIDDERKRLTVEPYTPVHLCMIAKDAELDIGRALSSASPYVDAIWVGVDKTSSDETFKIAEQYGTAFYVDSPSEVGFGEARNQSIQHVPEGDWVLWVDTDEELVGGPMLRKYTNRLIHPCFIVFQHHLIWEGMKLEPDRHVRVFRKAGGFKFQHCIHEQPSPWENRPAPALTILPDVHVLHYGYVTEAIRRRKCQFRNLPLLVKDREVHRDRKLGWFFIMRDFVNAAMWEAEAKHPEESMAYLDEAIGVYDENFSKETDPVYRKISFDLYQQAVKARRIGFPMDIALQPMFNGNTRTNVGRFVFRSIEEMKKTVDWQLEESSQELAKYGVPERWSHE